MTLKVIGAGFGRTGTLSLKIALEMLGLGPCYHMVEVFKNPDHSDLWSAAADGNVDWDKLFTGYASTVDWPSVYFWRELSQVYPDSKLILTKRTTASWVKSVNETIFRHLGAESPEDKPERAAQTRMAKKLVLERTFGGSIADPEHIGKIFEAHNEEVLRTIPAERLLVYEAREGWEPLCKFLGVPVPNVEYPRVNTTEEFQSNFGSK